VGENAELRQASLDGIAIADAIEELSQEREKLSVDLADRAATIKRLLEENSDLNFRLKSF
jgi:regulator of replication initiation timing